MLRCSYFMNRVKCHPLKNKEKIRHSGVSKIISWPDADKTIKNKNFATISVVLTPSFPAFFVAYKNLGKLFEIFSS